MNNHYPDSNRLDRKFSSLFNAADLSDIELERIADAPDLFRSIRAEIRAKQIAREPNPFGLDWKNFTARNWQVAAAFATLLIAFGLATIGFIARGYDSSPSVALENTSDVPTLALSQPEDPDTAQPTNTPARLRNHARESGKKTMRAVRAPGIRRQTRVESEEMGEFYALPYAADLAASDEKGEIVRVELPRSSLLAMGVQIQIEDQNSDSIKADLLIGEDGLMKAVRIVNK